MNVTHETIRAWAYESITQEELGLRALATAIDDSFADVVRALSECAGRVVVTGIGKSGHIGKKISSTFASTGTRSFFVHPAEASHGDLGMIDLRDIVIAISKSGESNELADVIAYCVRFGIDIVAITSELESNLAELATYVLLIPAIEEACPLGLAPTTSTTMALALGDALAIACLRIRGFQSKAFRDFHPGGKLGRKFVRVSDVMHTAEMVPLVSCEASLDEAVEEMNRAQFGCVGAVDAAGKLIGVFTDGDLRRSYNKNLSSLGFGQLMNKNPQVIRAESVIEDAMKILSKYRIPSVFVCDKGRPIGIIHLHDFLQRKFI